MEKWDVIVVGAGLSGLSSGALLANGGKKVLLLEKAAWPGGRQHSGMIDGTVVENGAHEISRAGHLEEIFSRIGKDYPTGTNMAKTEINKNGKWRPLLEGIDRSALRNILSEIAGYSWDDVSKHDDVSLKDWVSERTQDQGVHDLFFTICTSQLVANHYEDIAAGEAMVHLKEQLDRWGTLSKTVLRVDGGTSKATEALIDSIKENGGEIRTNTLVNDVIIEKGKACGVEIEVGQRIIPAQLPDLEIIEAPVVICAVPLWDLFNVVSEDKFPHWYREWVKGLRYKFSQVTGFVMKVKKLLWPFEVMRWYIPVLPRSKMAMGAYWEQDTVLQVYFQTHWNEIPNLFEMEQAINRRKVRELMKLFEEDVYEVLPELKQNIEWKVPYSEIFSVAAAPGQVGRFRPGMHTPIENFYLINDSVRESRGMGFQAVAHSGILCADEILGQK